MATVRKKISELTPLNSASLDTTLLGIDNGTTYKIELDTLADAVTARVNILDRDRLSSLESVTSSFETKGRSVISSSAQITAFGFISSSVTIPTGTISSSAQITSFGFISESVDISLLNSFTSSQSTLNTAFTNGINARLQTSSFNEFSTSVNSRIIAATNEQLNLKTGSYATTGSNVFKGQQIISGAFTVSISGNAFGVNENPTPNNIFWSYIPNDTNTTSIESGWIVNVETVGTYNVTNVEYDYPFVKITLSDALLQLPYRCNGYFSLPSSELKFGTDGVLKISGSLSVSGSITGSTNFNTIVNKPTLISGSSQLTSSYDSRYVLSGSITQTTWDNIASKPSDIVSSSAQITAFGFVSGSYETTGRGIISSSANLVTISSYNADSASFDTRINSITVSSGSNLTYLLEAYANVTYTLPGGFTEDPCRYSVVSVNENVPSNWFNTSSYTFTPQKAGYWEINAAYDVYRNTEASMAIRKNGSIVASAGSFNAVAQEVSKIIYLNGSTDYIDVVNTGGASLSRSQWQQRSWFQAKFVGNIDGSTDLLTTNNTFTGNNTFEGTTRFETVGGDEGGEIEFGVPQTNTSLSTRVVADVYQNRLRIFDGNTKGVFIDLSKAPTGVAGEIAWKTSGLINAGTFLTLDNLKVTCTTSGARGLSVGAVSTNFTANIAGWFGFSGGGGGASANNVTYTTTAASSAFGWGFNTEGDASNYIITDKTNSRVYRVTLMIGFGFNNNFISIERLY